MWPNLLVTFTEKILEAKLYFFCNITYFCSLMKRTTYGTQETKKWHEFFTDIHLYAYSFTFSNKMKGKRMNMNHLTCNILWSLLTSCINLLENIKLVAFSTDSTKLFLMKGIIHENVFCQILVLQKKCLSVSKVFLVPFLHCDIVEQN